MRRPTFVDLLKNPTQHKLIKQIEKKFGSPLPKDIQNLFLDIAVQSDIDIQTRVDWMKRLTSISERIIDQSAHPSEYPLFWIYLYGIVIEFFDYINRTRAMSEQINFMIPIISSIDELCNRLDEEDIKFIRYMRHSHVHISIGYIWHQAKLKDGKLSAVKAPFDPDAIDISQRILKSFGWNQQEVARHYSKIIFNDLQILTAAAIEAISS